ncbi:MAG TPA: OsmC family protein [Flavobacterium sp.]|nr:OsmC family protein [Flavobacterium sp.]
MTSKVTYTGQLSTASVHLQSGTTIITDAPTDNNGKGQAFSPTDMVSNSLATCMFTIMGIKANQLGVNFDGSTAAVTKVMQAEPRRIGKIIIVFEMNLETDQKTQTILERAGLSCPVFLSLHPEIEKDISFNWL